MTESTDVPTYRCGLADPAKVADLPTGAAPTMRLRFVEETALWSVSITPGRDMEVPVGQQYDVSVHHASVTPDGRLQEGDQLSSATEEEDDAVAVTLETETYDQDRNRLSYWCHVVVESPHVVVYGTYVMFATDYHVCNLPSPSIDTLAILRTPGGIAASSTTGGNRSITPFGYFWDNSAGRAVVGYDDDSLWFSADGVWMGTFGAHLATNVYSNIKVYYLRPVYSAAVQGPTREVP